ncbi:PH domain-containing protein [Virgibacillus sp. DJP39]|uniref:PH domain-containing protein n=1 Tax=Virgibacillus sp. DJP39 TaxID=3409790 RepID=UPI003BB70D62
MSEKQRLHPSAVFFTLLKTFKELIVSIGIGFFAFRDAGLYFVLGVGALILVMLVFSILSWYRYTYRVEDDELRIEYGILIRKKRYISKNRIQSIDLTQSVIHRLFKLTMVKIETAGSGTGTEASLKAVRLEVGESLREELKTLQSANREVEEVEETDTNNPSQTITFKRLFLAGTTSGSIGIIFIIISALFSELVQFVPDEYYENTFQTISSFSVILMIVFGICLLVIIWCLGIAGTMIKNGNFTITKIDNELFITRGLLEKKQTTIPVRRIQAVGIDESLLRQPLGYVTMYAEVAGGSVEKGEDFSTVLFPIIKKTEIDDFLDKFLPDYVSDRSDLTGLTKQALTFYLVRFSAIFILAVVATLFLVPQFAWAPIILLVLSVSLGLLQYKDAGFQNDGEQLTLRYRVLNRKTIILYHKRIQSFERKQHLFQRRASLATVKISIVSKLGAGKHYKIRDLKVESGNELASWYSYRD